MKNISKLAIDIGHNVNFDAGAVGIKSENVLNYQVGTKLIEKCRAAGVGVINCTPVSASNLNDSLSQRVAAVNSNNADFFISIHHNASPGGEGTEIYSMKGGMGEEVGNIIVPEIGKLGFRNRGVRDGSNLFVIRETTMPAILIECAFCDSVRDMASYDNESMAEAIFNGFCKAFEISSSGDSAVYHTVVKGETLWGLSRRYGVSLKSIVDLNGIRVASRILVGERIRIK